MDFECNLRIGCWMPMNSMAMNGGAYGTVFCHIIQISIRISAKIPNMVIHKHMTQSESELVADY